jgi:hypothetical protein
VLGLILDLAGPQGRCHSCGAGLEPSIQCVLEHYGMAHRDSVVWSTLLSAILVAGLKVYIDSRA